MTIVVVTPPDPVVTVDDARAHLREESTDYDDLIELYIAAATAHIDGPGGWLGRAIGEQELELRTDRFPWCNPTSIVLPCPPLISVESVTYIDSDGVLQTMDEADYRLIGVGGSAPRVDLVYGASWPTARSEAEAVRIAYTAGYGAAEDVPASIKAAILLMVGDMYSHRESAVVGVTAAAVPMSTTVEALLAPFRVWGA